MFYSVNLKPVRALFVCLYAKAYNALSSDLDLMSQAIDEDAVQNELTLISGDEHFEYIDTLDLVTW